MISRACGNPVHVNARPMYKTFASNEYPQHMFLLRKKKNNESMHDSTKKN